LWVLIMVKHDKVYVIDERSTHILGNTYIHSQCLSLKGNVRRRVYEDSS
jgi:hypothetical protein